ncbi:MAG: hypothetical protein ABIO44_11245 [Saprospiraceae bacterium]
MNLKVPSPIETLSDQWLNKAMYIKRDDLIHPIISGNKWRKIKGHLIHFKVHDYKKLLSVGSAHSNHLHALSYVCKELNIPFKALIYGSYESNKSHMISDLHQWQTEIEFINRNQVTDFNYSENIFLDNNYFIPEGGKGECSEVGLKELLNELPSNFDQPNNAIIIPCGSGTSLRGILNQSLAFRIFSFSPVKSMCNAIVHPRLHWLNDRAQMKFGGCNNSLIEFIFNFYEKEKILLDPIYNSRLFQLCVENASEFKDFDQIIYVNSGGAQDWRPYFDRYPSAIKLKSIFDKY